MSGTFKGLKDDSARYSAICCHDRSFLVEAGAGSGKTAIMAGRIALMLAEGISPRNIAAVTFTELAASELIMRVRGFVSSLCEDKIVPELRVALPQGLSQMQRENLAAASMVIDDITCSTIHGFCQRLIKPYPAEANIDPGASIMDSDQATLIFTEIVDGWLWERLSGEEGGLLAELVLQGPAQTVTLVRTIAEHLRQHRNLVAPPASPLEDCLEAFRQATADYAAFIRDFGVSEPDTATIIEQFVEMANALTVLDSATPAGLVKMLVSEPHPDLCTQSGTFRTYRKKAKWNDAAKREGLSRADGDRLNTTATTHHSNCCDAWNSLHQAVAGQILSVLIEEARPVLQRYRDYKRASAQLDFDDLIFAARDLLRDHEDVRRALGQRFVHVLVDEFQDTDPLQTEIFWRLCGEPANGESDGSWIHNHIRPGALFLVGDPKQAIYRFRGADVGAYIRARDAFKDQDPESLLSIATNFRSRASILTFVNERFEAPLSADRQPGFTALDPFHEDPGDNPCVAALDISVLTVNARAGADELRDAEAEAIAEHCARLIGSQSLLDRRSGLERLCQPGDIALLAPTGTDLWRYEEALERYGIPVATQAGKGFFRRQEIQDLIALTRVLADRRDRLALGALLRGPLVGLTEEQLLDIVWMLPRSDDEPDRIPRLDLGVDPACVSHPLARDIIEKLQALSRRSNATTPHELLSQAVDVMRLRPLLFARHRGQAERALANVDLYLSLSSSYAVRGLRAFAEAMTAAWTDEARAVEGRPDAQEEAVALFTMHASKGLEWPIIIPINTTTAIKSSGGAVIDRQTGIFHCKVMDHAPEGHDAALQAEQGELNRERVRLWYVAATRARESLILPRFDTSLSGSAWGSLVDFSLGNLPNLDVSHLSSSVEISGTETTNLQTHEIFAEEALAITARQTSLTWRAPSRDEDGSGAVLHEEESEIWIASDSGPLLGADSVSTVQGSRERGLILHKLMEEVLTGETEAEYAILFERANDLIKALGHSPHADAAKGLSPAELAGCINRTLMLPEIMALGPDLVAEFPLYAVRDDGGSEMAIAGIADALTLTSDGGPSVIVDWKSDVNPDAATLDHYRSQVRTYLEMTGAEYGLIVLMTSGTVIDVRRPVTTDVNLATSALPLV